jgi:hypothetical protein
MHGEGKSFVFNMNASALKLRGEFRSQRAASLGDAPNHPRRQGCAQRVSAVHAQVLNTRDSNPLAKIVQPASANDTEMHARIPHKALERGAREAFHNHGSRVFIHRREGSVKVEEQRDGRGLAQPR